MLERFSKQLPIFADLAEDQYCVLEKLFTLVNYSANEIIFEQGSPADYLFVVVDGEVSIDFNPDDGDPLTVAHIQDGGVFGWSAAFGSKSYTSGAVCVCDAQLLKVRGEALKNLRKNHPETGILILRRLAEVVAERMKNATTYRQVYALLEHALTNGVRPIGG